MLFTTTEQLRSTSHEAIVYVMAFWYTSKLIILFENAVRGDEHWRARYTGNTNTVFSLPRKTNTYFEQVMQILWLRLRRTLTVTHISLLTFSGSCGYGGGLQADRENTVCSFFSYRPYTPQMLLLHRPFVMDGSSFRCGYSIALREMKPSIHPSSTY